MTMKGMLSAKLVSAAGFAALLALSAASWMTAGAAPADEQKPDLSKGRTLYTVGYAHLDTQWRWTYPQVIREFIPNTMHDNFKLFEKYPDYIFNFSGANRYRMMYEYFPADYAKVKEYIKKGQWFPCGSSMEENDVNVPSAESIIRQVLYGNNYFRKEFGVASEEFMLPDCFGFPASLPSILAHCGLKGFSTQKLTWHSTMGIPFNVGVWEGLDGKSIIAALNAGDYTGKVKNDLSNDQGWVKRIDENGAKSGVFTDYLYYGVGDRGGAPTEGSVQWVEKSLKSDGPVKVVSAKADQMFKDITPEQAKKLPHYKGDLLLIEHSAGSISSAAYMKKWNRMNELLADAAERASVAAQWLGAAPYPADKLFKTWTLVMGGQFHDILPGTSHPKAYEYSQNDEVLAMNQFASMVEGAVGAVAQGLDTKGEGKSLVVYNPLSIERTEVVEASLMAKGETKAIKVVGPDGAEVPAQVLSNRGSRMQIAFLAKVAPVGFAVYKALPAEAAAASSELKAGKNTVENARYKVTVNAAGDVASIFDKKANKELLSAPARLAFQFNNPTQYPAWNMDWEDQKNPPQGYVDGKPSIKVIENGPVRVALEVTRQARGSKFVQRIRLAAGEAGQRVEFANSIDWKTSNYALKACFPLSVSNPLATYNWEIGTIQRGNNEPKKFEVPSHQWFDLTDKDGKYGVTVLSNFKYGSDKPSDNELRLTLLYTPGVRKDYRDQNTQDWGWHEITYALAGHEGDWREARTDWQGNGLNQPMFVFSAPTHSGKLGKSFSLASVSDPSVIVKAIKKAEDSDEIIVRLVQMTGKDAKGVKVALGQITAAREVDGQERPLGEAKVEDGKLVADFGPNAVRTFAVKLGAAPATLVAPKSQPVELPYDRVVASRDGQKVQGGFDAQGCSLAAEMLPATLDAEGVSFKLAPADGQAPNAVTCKGQTIALPEGKFNRVYLLAAAANAGNEGVKAAFKVGEQSTELTIQDWGGFVGVADTRVWKGDIPELTYDWKGIELASITPGFIKPAKVAWFASHRHNAEGQNELYAYSYLYKYVIDVKAGAKTLTLPSNEKIHVLAVTVADNKNDSTRPAAPLMDRLNRRGFDGKKYTWQYTEYKKPAKPAAGNALP